MIAAFAAQNRGQKDSPIIPGVPEARVRWSADEAILTPDPIGVDTVDSLLLHVNGDTVYATIDDSYSPAVYYESDYVFNNNPTILFDESYYRIANQLSIAPLIEELFVVMDYRVLNSPLSQCIGSPSEIAGTPKLYYYLGSTIYNGNIPVPTNMRGSLSIAMVQSDNSVTGSTADYSVMGTTPILLHIKDTRDNWEVVSREYRVNGVLLNSTLVPYVDTLRPTLNFGAGGGSNGLISDPLLGNKIAEYSGYYGLTQSQSDTIHSFLMDKYGFN